MPNLYKYLSEKYVDDFLHKGAVLLRSLSYFRDYEDAQARGDEFEGTKLYRPQQGLEVTLTATQEKFVLPHSFESTANEDEIFVFCLSTASDDRDLERLGFITRVPGQGCSIRLRLTREQLPDLD